VLRDVIIERVEAGEIVAIGGEAAVLGESMVIDIAGHEPTGTQTVEVIESRPVVVDGAIRHRLRLRKVGQDAASHEKP
jgi:hypothetical protein